MGGRRVARRGKDTTRLGASERRRTAMGGRRVARRGKDTTRLGASSSHGDVEEAHRTAIWDTRVVIGLSCGHDAH